MSVRKTKTTRKKRPSMKQMTRISSKIPKRYGIKKVKPAPLSKYVKTNMKFQKARSPRGSMMVKYDKYLNDIGSLAIVNTDFSNMEYEPFIMMDADYKERKFDFSSKPNQNNVYHIHGNYYDRDILKRLVRSNKKVYSRNTPLSPLFIEYKKGWVIAIMPLREDRLSKSTPKLSL